ncbi:MAG TPA: xanthine dehydrogenase family protein subunit M [Candidatus Acidoferrales bacterium]|jgi:CO/xanthine dehydrogenase FAD-binding subunit|nr:xanthine dehydrogenase family protein subunit M [Candidatus Acidoferrales bacterium]
MRASLPQYEMKAPASLGEAIGMMAEEPGRWKAFAGGTDLMVLLEAGKLAHRQFLSLWRVRELRGIAETSEEVRLGALTTYTEVLESATLRREFPLLCRAAAETGGVATQNRGTLGGNIANASPAADSLPALLVYDAELELVSAQGARRVPYHGFHTGYKTMDLRADEIIRCILLPRQKRDWRSYYRKVGTRRAQAISKVCLAAVAKIEAGRIQDLRIALGSVAPTVVRAVRTEAFLRGKAPTADAIRAAGEELAREIAPIDDVRSTARYRRRVAQNLLEEFLSGLAAGMPATR